MNGYTPIASGFGRRATRWPGCALIDISSFSSINSKGLSRKIQLLELCARIGYTPHAHSSLIDCYPSNELLEDYPCRNNILS